jgi:hypothetical protein
MAAHLLALTHLRRVPGDITGTGKKLVLQPS